MLVCNVSQLARRAAIAADVAETAFAADFPGTGNVVFAALVDDPASVAEHVDAFLGQIMREAASAASVVNAGFVYAGAVGETAAASTTQDATKTAAATTATWDPATISNVTLSNGNLTVTNNLTGSSADQGAHVAAAMGKTTGKYYFEIKSVTLTGASNCGPGIGTTASTYTGMGTNATVGSKVNISDSGRLYTNGSTAGITIGIGGTGNTVGIAVDLDNRRIWFHYSDVNPNNWNAGGTANPATGVGGVTVPAGTMVPFVTFGGSIFDSSGNVCTANFGATAFVSAVPSGFTSGWPA